MNSPPWDDIGDGLSWEVFPAGAGAIGMCHENGCCPRCRQPVSSGVLVEHAFGQWLQCQCGTAMEYAYRGPRVDPAALVAKP